MRKNENPTLTSDKTTDGNFVASLQKGLDVLTCFGRQHSRLTVSGRARFDGTSPASARALC